MGLDSSDIKNTESEALWDESHLEIMKGNYDLAKTKLGKLKSMVENESNPRRFDGYYNLMGMANLMSGNPKKGVEHFEKVIDPSTVSYTHLTLPTKA